MCLIRARDELCSTVDRAGAGLGIPGVECLPGVTAEQKHLSVVHKDLQKNEKGLGTDD